MLPLTLYTYKFFIHSFLQPLSIERNTNNSNDIKTKIKKKLLNLFDFWFFFNFLFFFVLNSFLFFLLFRVTSWEVSAHNTTECIYKSYTCSWLRARSNLFSKKWFSLRALCVKISEGIHIYMLHIWLLFTS